MQIRPEQYKYVGSWLFKRKGKSCQIIKKSRDLALVEFEDKLRIVLPIRELKEIKG